MMRSVAGSLLSVLAIGCTLLARPTHAQVVDDFESYTLGALPSPLWSDAGAIQPGFRVPPFPSAYVFSTLDAHGNPTKAVTTVGDLADSKGIFTAVPIGTFYSLHADVRVDRYSDLPDFPASDWAMQLSFGQNGVANWAGTPQAGIYASSLSKTWRVFNNASGVTGDIDLGIPAVIGVWYTVSQTLDVGLGLFHSRIVDAATGTLLIDRFDTFLGWNPADIHFDSFAFIAGEESFGDTIGNIGVVDNVNVLSATPEASSFVLLALGLVPLVVVVRRRRRA